MSIAFPASILRRGHVHPDVITAATAVQAAGWRVTSVYRTEGTHSEGISFDCAPMVFAQGGFGERTAQLVWEVVKRAVPHQKWMANAELDHIHVMLFKEDTLAMNVKGGTVLIPLLRQIKLATR